MKSKLTLRLDEGLKERAKRLAEERRTSVSKIIEDYSRLLLRGSSNGPVGGSEGDISYEDVSYEDVSGEDIGEWSKPGTMDVPSLSKSIGTTYAQNTSAVPTGSRREKIVELARNGRTPKELAEEFEPTQTTISGWLKQADRDEGACSDGPTTEEKEEIRELRKKLRQLQQERDILANRCPSGTAWFARETGDVPPKSSDS